MPIELAVPTPTDGAGLLFTATVSLSKFQAVMTDAFAPEAENIADAPMTAASAMARRVLNTFTILPSQINGANPQTTAKSPGLPTAGLPDDSMTANIGQKYSKSIIHLFWSC
jgi:hypothetical protein